MAHVERFAAMGTRVELHLFGAADAGAAAAARRAIEAVDDALTIHRPSAATALNEVVLAGGRASVADPILRDALVRVDEANRATNGFFDPAADRRFGIGGWDVLCIEGDGARVSAARPVALDFGGFGKGYALDRAVAVLRAAGVTSACLSAGESSLAVIGDHPLGGGWPFAIPDPREPGRFLVEVELSDESLSISATLGAGTAAPDRAAMIRPHDAMPVTRPRCAVAIDASGAMAEAMSTALVVADDAAARRLLGASGARRHLFDLAPQSAGMALT